MNLLHALLFGIIEGITEFLPISSTGHLTIVEKLLGYSITDPDITAFTAVIQVGAVLATLLFLRKDVARIVPAWLRGLTDPGKRGADYQFGWAIIIGTVPIAVIGLLFKDQIETTLRSLWFVAFALLLWSGVMWFADRQAKQTRHQADTTWKDTLIIGLVQCLALIPGVSRSGATMSAGLLRGFDRVTVTKLSFFLSVPALLAAGTLQAISKADQISEGVGWTATILATVVSFIVAYLSVTLLLRFIARHTYTVFIVYRVILALILIGLLSTGVIAAT
jgi:undecaprenyl-diphosphatase